MTHNGKFYVVYTKQKQREDCKDKREEQEGQEGPSFEETQHHRQTNTRIVQNKCDAQSNKQDEEEGEEGEKTGTAKTHQIQLTNKTRIIHNTHKNIEGRTQDKS